MKRIITLLLLLLSMACDVGAQDYLVGVRGGSSFEGNAGYFRQADIFAGGNLPWQWDSYFGLSFKPRVEASAGCLSGGSKDGFVGTLGPVIELREGEFPVTLEGGVSPTLLSRYNFSERNLGGRFEFTDHLGLDWRITKYFTAGWRYQHMSNAGIYKHNPGLNLQMLSASYRF
jgi:lipid A 3-O-deacylase